MDRGKWIGGLAEWEDGDTMYLSVAFTWLLDEAFSRALFARARDNSGLDWGDKEPPTFHEIRSLSERLYKAEGRVNTQELLGHKDPRMTRVYHDPRGAEFIDVAVR